MVPFLVHNAVEFKVPTGNVSSLNFVLFITIAVVICCAIMIAVATGKNVAKVKVK